MRWLMLPQSIQETDKAYIAGFVDGEGSVLVANGYLRVSISQKEPAVLEWIQSIYGGRLISNHDGFMHELIFNGQRATKLVDDLLPYLQVKQVQFECAKLFIATITEGGYQLSDTVYTLREELGEKIKKANNRGGAPCGG